MDCVNVYVLTTLTLDGEGSVTSKNVGVTFNIHDAEAHRDTAIENAFEKLQIEANWREDAATTGLITAMRDFARWSLLCKMRR